MYNEPTTSCSASSQTSHVLPSLNYMLLFMLYMLCIFD